MQSDKSDSIGTGSYLTIRADEMDTVKKLRLRGECQVFG